MIDVRVTFVGDCDRERDLEGGTTGGLNRLFSPPPPPPLFRAAISSSPSLSDDFSGRDLCFFFCFCIFDCLSSCINVSSYLSASSGTRIFSIAPPKTCCNRARSLTCRTFLANFGETTFSNNCIHTRIHDFSCTRYSFCKPFLYLLSNLVKFCNSHGQVGRCFPAQNISN